MAEKADKSAIKDDESSYNVVEYDDEPQTEEPEESPILIAQRYLNIYHQIHIFSKEKQEEFDESLLLLDNRTKELMPTIPGGRILLEHIRDLEEKKGLVSSISDNLLAKKNVITPETETNNPQPTNANIMVPTAATAVALGGEINVSPNFAKNLADSLAEALKNNNLLPQQNNFGELSSIIDQSLSNYTDNLQQFTKSLLSQNIQQFDAVQERLQNQFNEQITKQNLFQEKLYEKIQTQVSQVAQITRETSLQTQQIQKETLQIPQAAPIAANSQFNAQNNNANTTTINNINIDSSSFKDLTAAIREAAEKNHQDLTQIIKAFNSPAYPTNLPQASLPSNNNELKQLIDALNKNLIGTKNNKKDISAEAITETISKIIKENNQQQIAALKAFGETLSSSIIKSQNEMSKTLSKAQPVMKNNNMQPAAELHDIQKNNNVPAKKNNEPEKTDKKPQKLNNQNNKNDKTEKTKPVANNKTTLQNDNKSFEEKPKPELNDKPEPPVNNAKSIAEPVENKKVVEKQTDKQNNDTATAQIDKLLADEFEEVMHVDITPSDNEISLDDATDSLASAFAQIDNEPIISKSEPEEEVLPKVQPITTNTESKPQENILPKPRVHSHLYDDAMQKIKSALSSDNAVELNDLDIMPVSLNPQEEIININEDEIKTSETENDIIAATFNPTTDDSSLNNDEWEYVDENGNPLSPDEAGDEWEYVDENGNPLSPDEAGDEWEYVDENGNPVISVEISANTEDKDIKDKN